ncbi:MAG: type I restriction enzyme HsdR N-terminal domain-containing protein [Bacteroidia bacterium]|nr:type I restriction enzyme HsdR N-terminal domain-containing protein [Bacteroidia bacterium]
MNLIFPSYKLKTEIRGNQEYVWDIIRKKWILLQKEEYIRQLLVHYLIEEKQVSRVLISVEKEILYNELRKRFDVVVFNREGKPHILCEVKAPDIPLAQDTLHQIARYNAVIKAPHLLITNGQNLLFFSQTEAGKYIQKKDWEVN